MKTDLIDIPGLFVGANPRWKVKAIFNGEVSLAVDALDRWRADPKMKRDYKLIVEAIQYAANVERVTDERIVKGSENFDHGEVYEFRAFDPDTNWTGRARLMFFYDESDESLIICTNSYDKNIGNYESQNLMFSMCDRFRQEYERNKRSEK